VNLQLASINPVNGIAIVPSVVTSAVVDNHLPESLSGTCGCFRYHELNIHKVTKSQSRL
jgi:hypothetical protein